MREKILEKTERKGRKTNLDQSGINRKREKETCQRGTTKKEVLLDDPDIKVTS